MGWFSALKLALSIVPELISVGSAIVDLIEEKTDAKGMGKEKKALAMTAMAQSLEMADGMANAGVGKAGWESSSAGFPSSSEEATEASGMKKGVVMGAAGVLIDSVVTFNNAANAVKAGVAAVGSLGTASANDANSF